MKKIILGIIIGIMVLGFGGCALTLLTAKEAVESVDKSLKDDAKKTESKDELLKAMLDKAKPAEKRSEYEYTVEFNLVNDSKENFDYIQLNADVFDKDGVKLENVMTNITDVKAGQKFQLKLDLYPEGAKSYKITSISSEAK